MDFARLRRPRHATFAGPDIDRSSVVDTAAPDGTNREQMHGPAALRKGTATSSHEPERPEYERRVVGWLRRHFLDNDYPVYYSGGRIRFEDVRLEGAGTRESAVVITFRAPGRPGCLYGRREDAVGPPEPLEDPGGAP
jgi:hypothetical protein